MAALDTKMDMVAGRGRIEEKEGVSVAGGAAVGAGAAGEVARVAGMQKTGAEVVAEVDAGHEKMRLVSDKFAAPLAREIDEIRSGNERVAMEAEQRAVMGERLRNGEVDRQVEALYAKFDRMSPKEAAAAMDADRESLVKSGEVLRKRLETSTEPLMFSRRAQLDAAEQILAREADELEKALVGDGKKETGGVAGAVAGGDARGGGDGAGGDDRQIVRSARILEKQRLAIMNEKAVMDELRKAGGGLRETGAAEEQGQKLRVSPVLEMVARRQGLTKALANVRDQIEVHDLAVEKLKTLKRESVAARARLDMAKERRAKTMAEVRDRLRLGRGRAAVAEEPDEEIVSPVLLNLKDQVVQERRRAVTQLGIRIGEDRQAVVVNVGELQKKVASRMSAARGGGGFQQQDPAAAAVVNAMAANVVAEAILPGKATEYIQPDPRFRNYVAKPLKGYRLQIPKTTMIDDVPRAAALRPLKPQPLARPLEVRRVRVVETLSPPPPPAVQGRNKAEEAKPEKGKPEKGKPEKAKPEKGEPEDGKVQGEAEEAKAEKGKPEDGKVQGKPEDGKVQGEAEEAKVQGEPEDVPKDSRSRQPTPTKEDLDEYDSMLDQLFAKVPRDRSQFMRVIKDHISIVETLTRKLALGTPERQVSERVLRKLIRKRAEASS